VGVLSYPKLNPQIAFLCAIWDDVRTYLTSTIDPKEKAALVVAISYFKNMECIKCL